MSSWSRSGRGCVERILRTRPGALVVDPAVVAGEFTKVHDQYAAEHLVGVAAVTVRDVARMQAGAAGADKRLLTLYRFRTRRAAVELRFAGVGGVRQDRGSCLSVCCI